MSFRRCQKGRSLGRLAVCLLLGLLPASRPAWAQTTMTVSAGFEGLVRSGRPFPVDVSITNSGPARRVAVTVTPVARGPAWRDPDYSEPRHRAGPLPLAPGGRWRGFLYPTASSWSRDPNVALQVNGQEVQSIAPTLTGVGSEDTLFVAAGERAAALKFLAGTPLGKAGPGRPTPALQVGAIAAGGLPDSAAGYAAVDILFLNDPVGDALNGAQQRALDDWVASGGTLVLAAGPGWQRLTSPATAALLPARLTGSRIVRSTADLGHFTGGVPPPARPFVAATAEPVLGANVLARGDAGVPLIVAGPHGLGRVVLLAFDPFALRDWSGVEALWTRLARPARGVERYLNSVATPGTNEAASRWPYALVLPDASVAAVAQADPPDLWLVVLFLAAYVLVASPLNYLVLRRLGRRELAWVTAPVIVLVFTAAAYGAGLGIHGGRLLLIRTAVVEAAAGARQGPALTFAGIFPPRHGDYEVTALTSGWQLELRDLSARAAAIVASDPERIEGLSLDTWQLGTFAGSGMVSLGGGISARQTPGGRLALRNDSPFELEDCRLVLAAGVTPLGAFHRGAAISLPLGRRALKPVPMPAGELLPEALAPQLTGNEQERRLKEALLAPFVHPGWYAGYGGGSGMGSSYTKLTPLPPGGRTRPPVLAGWVRQPVLDVRVDGRTGAGPSVTLFLIHLPSGR